MMRDIKDLLTVMFPGDAQLGVPGFETLDDAIMKIAEVTDYQVLLSSLLEERKDTDINILLSHLKKLDYELTRRFINHALDLYFTHPLVVSSLKGGESTLYPHARSLDYIDYDLLKEVFEENRGGIE